MALGRGRKTPKDDETRELIAEAEANRRRLVALTAQLCLYIDNLRDLTTQVNQRKHGGATGDG